MLAPSLPLTSQALHDIGVLMTSAPPLAGAALKRGLREVASFRLPNQTNRLALIIDPLTDQVPFTFGIEIFERGHKTTPHTHPSSQELFFILAGQALRPSCL